jgi:hypothetical protein
LCFLQLSQNQYLQGETFIRYFSHKIEITSAICSFFQVRLSI